MKILFVARYRNIYGGVQDMIRKLGKAFVARGHKVCVLSDDPLCEAERGTIKISCWTRRNLFSLLARQKFDVVYFFEPRDRYILLSLLFGLFRRQTIRIMIFCGSISERPRLGYRFLRKFHLHLRLFDGFIGISRYALDKGLGGIETEKGVAIPPPLDLSLYRKSDYSKPNILTINRIDSRKNLLDLLRLAERLKRRLPNFYLDIVGGGPRREYLRELKAFIRKHKLQDYVRWHIDAPEKEKLSLLRRSRLYVTTSSHEMFGIATAEAMASGLPVVAYANSATEELVKKAGGLLAKDGDLDGLERQVLRLWTDDNLFDQVAAKELAYAKNFDIEKVADQYLALAVKKSYNNENPDASPLS